MQFLHRALVQHGDAGFLRGDVDEDFFAHDGVADSTQTARPKALNKTAVSYNGKPMMPL